MPKSIQMFGRTKIINYHRLETYTRGRNYEGGDIAYLIKNVNLSKFFFEYLYLRAISNIEDFENDIIIPYIRQLNIHTYYNIIRGLVDKIKTHNQFEIVLHTIELLQS